MSQNEMAAIQDWLRGRDPLWGLDFDGTLVPLNVEPGKVWLSASRIALVESFGRSHECAIVSGRAVGDLRKHAPIAGVHLIGNHGGQVIAKDGSVWEWHSERWQSWRAGNLKAIAALASEHGARLEDKNLTLTVHFREAPDARWWCEQGRMELETRTQNIAQVMSGKFAWNIIPAGAPSKGTTVRDLCWRTGHDSVIYFGDEPTDEAVFLLKDIPVFGVKVGQGQTAARLRVNSPADVLMILAQIAGLPAIGSADL